MNYERRNTARSVEFIRSINAECLSGPNAKILSHLYFIDPQCVCYLAPCPDTNIQNCSIRLIYTEPQFRKLGKCSSLLDDLIFKADEFNISLTLSVRPFEFDNRFDENDLFNRLWAMGIPEDSWVFNTNPTVIENLRKFYYRFGFHPWRKTLFNSNSDPVLIKLPDN